MVDVEVVATGARLGECPVWSSTERRLYWSDIEGRVLHRLDPETGRSEHRRLPGRPGSFALVDGSRASSDQLPGRLLVAMERELVWFDWESEIIEPWLELESPGAETRLNDGRCDPAGRFIVGSMTTTGTPVFGGSLHQVEPDGSWTTLLTEVGVANGTAFDAERRLAYFADSWAESVWVWDYDLDTGARTNRRLFLDYGPLPGAPDGACVDADGCYWSASVFGSAVIRVTPDGRVDRRIELPVSAPTMPCFGGTDLSTLYITSLVPDRYDPDRDRSPVGPGSLLALDVGMTGRPEPAFAG